MARKKDEERKRGLPPIQLRAAEGASNWMQAGYGAQSGGLLGGGNLTGALGLGGKVGVAVLLAALGAGAFGVGRMIAPRGLDASVGVQSLPFDHSLPTQAGGGVARSGGQDGPQSAMQVVPESLGAKPDPQADAAAAAGKASGAGDAPAAAAPDAAAAAMMSPPPPAVGAADAAGKSPFSTKFGALSQFGAGHPSLNGGAGMASINFDSKPLGAPKPFSQPTTATAKRLQARANPAPRPSAHARGFAYNQLARTNGLSRQGAAASGETSSTLAGAAFNNGTTGGQVLTGGGAGATPVTGAGAAAAGGPIASGTQNENTGTTAPPAASHTNASPWQTVAYAGVAALLLGGLLLTFAQKKISAAKKMFHSPDPVTKAAAASMLAMGKMLAVLGMALGAIGIGIGMALWKQFHQQSYGGIFMAGGALLVGIGAFILMRSDDKDADGQEYDTGQQQTQNTQNQSGLGTDKVDPGKVTGGQPTPNQAPNAAPSVPKPVQDAGTTAPRYPSA